MPDETRKPNDDAAERPFAESLCWRCANHRPIPAARSVFIMCTALPTKYPRQPIAACPSFQPGAAP